MVLMCVVFIPPRMPMPQISLHELETIVQLSPLVLHPQNEDDQDGDDETQQQNDAHDCEREDVWKTLFEQECL